MVIVNLAFLLCRSYRITGMQHRKSVEYIEAHAHDDKHKQILDQYSSGT
jgi:hypothetical protein